MNLLRITALLVYAYGVFSYGSLLLLLIRRSGFGGEPASLPCSTRTCKRRLGFAGTAITAVSLAWFTVMLLLTLVELSPEIKPWPLLTAGLFLVSLYPPLIMHASYERLREASPGPRHPGWKLSLWAVYVVSQVSAILSFLGFAELIAVPLRSVITFTTASVALLFTVAAIYKSLAMFRSRSQDETAEARLSRRWDLGLLAVLVVLFGLLVVAYLVELPLRSLLEIVLRSMPLAFLFIGTYYEDRFEFFDLLIKRGANMLLTVVSLTAYFGLALPWLQNFPLGWARPWVYAVALLPVAASLPWLYGSVGRALDSYWLGRQFSSAEAVKHFLSVMRSATSEARLIEQAEIGLAEIFHAPVRIELGRSGGRPPSFEPAVEAPIGAGTDRMGAVHVGERTNRVPLFSEDTALLGSLTDVLAYMLQNMRLQRGKQEQEQQAKELSLHASRSELKALRAQINPHFLFNALNAIAGLIHRDPSKADRTVEQLAEVFRYTLRGSDTEWTVLDQEMEFVSAYLDVEQARFGQRLRFEVIVDDAVKPLKIPTMMVQTLVENAVKHGVAELRGGGTIVVAARRQGERLLIEVADNGPGFQQDRPQGRSRPARKISGYGLRNIRERLEGYYGATAWLSTRRDETLGLTVVCIDMPLTHEPEGAASGRVESAETSGGRH